MLDDSLITFTKELCQFLLGQDEVNNGLLVKKHSVNLQAQGEFSFTNTVKSWQNYLNKSEADLNDCSLLKCIGKKAEDIAYASEEWQLPVKVAIEIKDRVHLFLNRCSCIRVGLASGSLNNARIKDRLGEARGLAGIDPQSVGTCVTYVRVQCLTEVINRLFAVNDTHLSELPKVVVTSKSSSSCNEGRLVLCGAVININTNAKENTLSGKDFVRLRQNELTLIAQHKYGVRAASDENWKEYIAHLGESAVTFEMLQTKPTSAVKINFHLTSGSSKGAAFVLYNCARLETIIRTYNERVGEGIYPPLPNFENIDFTLLTGEMCARGASRMAIVCTILLTVRYSLNHPVLHMSAYSTLNSLQLTQWRELVSAYSTGNKDEWCLIFNYVLGLPTLLRSCVEINETLCDFRPHLLCGFLSAMVKLISQYYRRTRILTEPRKHLLPVMFARLHMLTVLNETLKMCLLILNIKSVSQM